jgi:hypothetical protein
MHTSVDVQDDPETAQRTLMLEPPRAACNEIVRLMARLWLR